MHTTREEAFEDPRSNVTEVSADAGNGFEIAK